MSWVGRSSIRSDPFHWIADVTVMEAFESGVLDLPDFYFAADDYRYRFETEAKRQFLDLLRERLNAGVRYKGRLLKWDTVMEKKANEMGRHLTGECQRIDFSEPAPILDRFDSHEFRANILSVNQSETQELGITKSTFHYLRRRAQGKRPLRVYGKIRQSLI